MQIQLSLITTALLLSTSCAHVPIKDEQFCAVIPGGLGATCDNVFTAHQIILTEPEWQALQAEWASHGQATECTQASTIGDIKAEIEKLCSEVDCDYPTQQKIIKGLSKVQRMGKYVMSQKVQDYARTLSYR